MRFLFLFLILLAVGGCQKKILKQAPQQTLRLNLRSEPLSLDPRLATDVTSSNLTKLCFEGLMRLDEKGEAIPAIAESIECSESKKLYRFRLREAYWSDGRRVTAEDFAFSWRSMLDPQFACPFSKDLYILKNGSGVKENNLPIDHLGVHAKDDGTLEVALEYPTPYFLKLLATRSFLPIPAHIASKTPGWSKEAGASFVCNGPFSLKKWKHQNEVILAKNPFYWNAQHVQLEEIQLPIIEDETTELVMFNNDELDWAGNPFSTLPIDALDDLRSENLHYYPLAATYFYIFNTQSYPLNNAALRKALCLAINRREIVDNITKGGQDPAFALVPPELIAQQKKYFNDGDAVDAQRFFAQALKELGLTVETFPTLSLAYNTMQGHHLIAQAIQQQWHKVLGIQVELENKEWKVFLDEVYKGQFQIAKMGAVAMIDDPLSFLENYSYHDRTVNFSGWNDSRYTELIFQAMRESNLETRIAQLKEAQDILMHAMPIAPIYFYKGSYLKKDNVHNVHLTPWNDFDCSSAYIQYP